MGNAFKYTKSGSISVSLNYSKPSQNGKTEVQLLVEDTGQGISAEFQKHHLWTPFMQENTHAVGTGLGLSIVKQVIEDIGGTISVDSEVGRGTKIKVSLETYIVPQTPADVPDPNPGSVIPKEIKLGFVAPSGRSEQARVDRRIRSAVSKTCSGWIGCSYEEVRRLSDLSGHDVCMMLESDFQQWMETDRRRDNPDDNSDPGGQKGPPIIVLSSLIDLTVRRSITQEQGNVIFINQPFGPRKLSRTIKSALEGHGHPVKSSTVLQDPTKTNGHTRPPKPRLNSEVSPKRRSSSTPSVQPPSTPSSPLPNVHKECTSPDCSVGKVLLVEDNTVNMKVSNFCCRFSL